MAATRTLAEVLAGLGRDASWQNVTAQRTFQPRPARFTALPAELHPRLRETLADRGIKSLYSHQEQVWDLVGEGRDVVLATPTASGKSLAYHLPVLDTLLQDPRATALYLFPTKALARDQLNDLRRLWPGSGGDIEAYDGDQSPSARRRIRSRARLIITNPDMLHTALLPHHPSWAGFFSGLRYVVLDEVHQYRGIFGSHAANVFRRLERICRFHGSRPLFIAASATIANPGELSASLTGRSPVAVLDSGAPGGRKDFIFYNPPLVDHERGIRAGNWWETVRIVLAFITAGHQAIVFARSRIETEIILTYLTEALRKGGYPGEWVRGYRGGYLPAERRAVEKELREGRVRAVVSTTALELGIDIGDLDLCVMSGYPGSVSSTYQQAGRAGRRFEDSAAFLVAENSPLDQYIVNHPDYFFGQPPESAALNPDNPNVLASHLACACFELPVNEKEQSWAEGMTSHLEALRREGSLHRSGEAWHWVGQTYPAADVSLRSASAQAFTVLDAETGRQIGIVDAPSVPLLLHEEAVYLHGGQTFIVEKLDAEQRHALARAAEVDFFTEPLVRVTVEEGRRERVERYGEFALSHGEVQIITCVTGYRKLRLFTHQQLGEEELDFPESRMATSSCCLTLPAGAGAGTAVLQGTGYLLSRVAPLYVLCDAGDIRSYFKAGSGEEGVLELHFYDNHPGGAGFSAKLFEQFPRLVASAAEVAGTCLCLRGCPSCLGPGIAADPEGKADATRFLVSLGEIMGAGGQAEEEGAIIGEKVPCSRQQL